MSTENKNLPEKNQKVVFLHGFDRSELDSILSAVKSVIPEPKEIAFCTTTKNNLEMKVKELIPEVLSDHYQMVWAPYLKKLAAQGSVEKS